LVRQRQEITGTYLRPEDYACFIREAAERAPIFAVAIQGYEPLLPESLAYTQSILATARFLGLPTSLVTNGVKLADAVDLLKMLSPNKIAISLDAARAQVHDSIRGVTGAWSETVRGVERAIGVLTPVTSLTVASVLMPSRRRNLDDMPALLREIGIDRWIINPLLRVGSDSDGGPVSDLVNLYRDLLILQEAADRAGIRLTVDDEFGNLGHDAARASQSSFRALHVRTLPSNVEIFRLVPSGRCSTGNSILKRVTTDTPRWCPGAVHASDFLEKLSGSEGLPHLGPKLSHISYSAVAW
jgi:MoaA/NifB/PqqE/SkfB family radical SAM enzyme